MSKFHLPWAEKFRKLMKKNKDNSNKTCIEFLHYCKKIDKETWERMKNSKSMFEYPTKRLNKILREANGKTSEFISER